MAVVREMTGSDLFHDLKSRDRDNFTYEGCVALVEWLDELSDETNVPVIYDPIGFCVEYSEYGSLCELQADYDNIETIEEALHRDHSQGPSPIPL